MSAPARVRVAASAGVLKALRARLGDLLEAAGRPRDAYARGVILATMLGHGSWTALSASARRETRPDAFDEALDLDGLDLRLEGQVSGLLWRVPELDGDGDAAQGIVAELRASADPRGLGSARGPCAGRRWAYRGRGSGVAFFLVRDAEGREEAIVVDAARDTVEELMRRIARIVDGTHPERGEG